MGVYANCLDSWLALSSLEARWLDLAGTPGYGESSLGCSATPTKKQTHPRTRSWLDVLPFEGSSMWQQESRIVPGAANARIDRKDCAALYPLKFCMWGQQRECLPG